MCSNYATYWYKLQNITHWFHGVLAIITYNVEVYSSRTGQLGSIIRASEVFGATLYLGLMVSYLGAFGNGYYIQNESHPPCANNPEFFNKWAGTCQAWFMIEIGVYFFYFTSMLILMAKSRVTKIGSDQQKQFDPIYLSFMINKLAKSINFDIYQEKKTYA